jgi:hypothetical protein
LKIEEVKSELKSQEDIIAMLSAHRDEALASIRALGTSSNSLQEVYQLHRGRFDELQGKIQEEMAKKVELHSKLARLLMEISMVGMASHVEFSQKLLAVNLAARREVDLPIDEQRYRELQTLIAKESQEVSHAFVEEMKGWISEQERKLDS